MTIITYTNSIDCTIAHGHRRNIKQFLTNVGGITANQNQITSARKTGLSIQGLDVAIVGREVELLGQVLDGDHHQLGHLDRIYG